jgi:hypothetical protein
MSMLTRRHQRNNDLLSFMTAGMLMAMTLPGLVLVLLLLAVVEQGASRLRRCGLLTRRHRPARTATGMDFMAALTQPEKHLELQQRATDKVRRLEQGDGAPRRHTVDLHAGTARITRSADRN